ncbi:MAG: NHLP leader peptide family natural product precursor [Syntrophomonadaceae bacterium]|nr:NHLP leader peptide family natural product precursor [Syntrophomonadaceae bacterium]
METKCLSTLELNQLIAERASENEEFRLALLSNPKSALEKEFAVTFPEGISVQVHVENSQELHLIIPATKLDELSDDQLENVAGGVGVPGVVTIGSVKDFAKAMPHTGGGGGIDVFWNWPTQKNIRII